MFYSRNISQVFQASSLNSEKMKLQWVAVVVVGAGIFPTPSQIKKSQMEKYTE
jgi:hypothetical protein